MNINELETFKTVCDAITRSIINAKRTNELECLCCFRKFDYIKFFNQHMECEYVDACNYYRLYIISLLK